MKSIEEGLTMAQKASNKKIKNQEKLSKQQDYYNRLMKSGIAHKQPYNLKSTSLL